MPINSFLYPGAKVVPPFTVANSIRLNQGDDPDMKKTIGAPTSNRKFSVSCWVKLSNLGVQRNLWGLGATSGATGLSVRFQDDDTLDFFDYNGSGNTFGYSTNQVFRDVSAWSHFLFAVDTEQSTAHNRVRIYHNGVEIEKTNLTDNPGDPSEDANLTIADGHTFKVGDDNAGANEWAGYIAEFVYIDGLQLTPSSFGQFNDDTPTIWEPIDVTGLTFGNNGFYLDFEDSSNLGNDANGGTDLTETNIQSLDQSTDTCTNNFCTWNPLIVRLGRTQPTFSEGNLKCQHNDTGGNTPSWGTFLLNSGKWYWEVKITSAGIVYCGVWQPGYNNGDVDDALNGIVVYRTDGNKQAETAATAASYGDSFTTGDIIGVAVDVDTGTIWFSKNGTWQNSATISEIGAGTTTNSAYTGKSFATNGILPSISAYQSSGNAIVEANFGGGTSFTVSSGNADANGFGNFEYPVPSGYFSLCTKNLAEFG